MYRCIRSGLVLLLCTIVIAPAGADVIPVKTLFAVLDGTPKLRRPAQPPTVMHNWKYYAVRGTQVAGFVVPEYNDYGFLQSGADLLIVPLESGGSGGVFETLLFTGIKTARRFIGYIPSGAGHLNVSIQQGRIVASTPNYGPNDPNCCPSSRTYQTYTLDGIKLKKLDAYTEKLR